ncbi:MAG: AAA family ATPase, partial [Acutalibacteraceae bacterium]
ASKGPCVIVGRCADFVLKDIPNVLKVFIRADKSLRIQRAVRLYGLTEKDAAKLIKKTDNVRADYYRYHTGQSWSDAKNYNLVIDTGYTGTDIAAKIIEECLENPDIAGSTSV